MNPCYNKVSSKFWLVESSLKKELILCLDQTISEHAMFRPNYVRPCYVWTKLCLTMQCLVQTMSQHVKIGPNYVRALLICARAIAQDVIRKSSSHMCKSSFSHPQKLFSHLQELFSHSQELILHAQGLFAHLQEVIHKRSSHMRKSSCHICVRAPVT